MKKIIVGIGLIISSVILYSMVHLAAAMYIPNITGWSTPPGRFGTALIETRGVFPTNLSIFMGLIGAGLVSIEAIEKIYNKLKDRNNP